MTDALPNYQCYALCEHLVKSKIVENVPTVCITRRSMIVAVHGVLTE